MRSHAQIVTDAGEERLSALGSVPLNTASSWKRRDRIPSDMWKPIAEEGLASLEELASYAAANPRTRFARPDNAQAAVA